MNPILIHFLNASNGQEYEVLIKGLILFWWFILMPTTITSISVDQFNTIYRKAIIQVNDTCPHLAGHWKNPIYHMYILVCALSQIVGSPLTIILNLMDRK